MSSTTETPTSHRQAQARPAFRALLRAERLRVFSTRSTWVVLMVGLVLPVAFTAGFVSTVGKAGGVSLQDPQAVATVLSAGSAAALMATLIGVLSVTSEYRHRTASLSLVLAGRRDAWLLPKLCVAALTGLLLAAAAQVVVLAVGIPGLRSHGLAVSLTDGHLIRASLGTASLGPFAALIGVGVGLLVRNQLAAVAGTVLYTTLVEAALINFAPAAGRYLIGGANAAVAQDPTIKQLVSVPLGYLLLTGWALLTLTAGRFRLTREDVPSE